MSDILLAKPHLPPDWIDTSVGEPHVVRDALFQSFDMKDWKLPTPEHCWEYQAPQGYAPLVDLLSFKHGGHKVIVTNGAKQALGATFYALKKMDKNHMTMRVPYWALIPALAEAHGVECPNTFAAPHYSDSEYWSKESRLLVAPNNPDGFIHDEEEFNNIFQKWKGSAPLIHDAAYYTYSYLPRSRSLPMVGDVQIYSLSKMLGLSGLRIGYAVCPNLEFYKLIKEYMEMMTVGASLPSQLFAYDLMNQMRGYPSIVEKFENISYSALENSKRIIQNVNQEILEIPKDITGMFGFFKVGPKADFQKAKVNTIDGALFGMPGFVRMNLAFPTETMQEIVRRLNESAKL